MIYTQFIVFLLASLILIITPGQDMILVMLGFAFALLTFLVKAPIGYVAGRLSKWLRSKPAIHVWINRVSGGVLIALGIRLAFEKRA